MKLDDEVWVVARVGRNDLKQRLIGKGLVKFIADASNNRCGLEPVLVTVHFTELYESTSNTRIVGLSQTFNTEQEARQFLFLLDLRDPA